jgi:translation initiation factor 1A
MSKKNYSKNNNNKNITNNSKNLILKEDQETYGQVTNALGNNRLLVKCFHDGKERVCTIRGSMRKKIWINKNDIVLISLRDFQDDKADIIYKYDEIDVKKLKKLNELNIEENHINDCINDDELVNFDEI